MSIMKKFVLSKKRKEGAKLKSKERIDGFGICRGARSFMEEKTSDREFW